MLAATIGSMQDIEELEKFAQRLNELCDDMKIPPKGKARQTSLAKVFELTQKGARKWLEAEGYPSIAMGKRIAAWGGVSFDWLMTGNAPKTLAGDHPLVARYQAADPATRTLIDMAIAKPEDPVPTGLSPSVKAMVEMARAALREELKKKNANPDSG